MEKYIGTIGKTQFNNQDFDFSNTIKELVNGISAQPDYDGDQGTDGNGDSAGDFH